MVSSHYEKQRLKALYSFHIIDTGDEPHFDQMLKLVGNRFSVPMCFINLVDENRFWFKASFGAVVKELCRSPGFCETTLQQKRFYEIPNALEEPTVASTEWVRGEAGVRYYAGAPLLTKDNFAIGTLCMFDSKPRKFDQNDVGDLEAFAEMIMQLIELNKLKEQQLRKKNLESIGRITGGVAHDFNNQLAGITSALDLLEFQPNQSERCTNLINSIRQCTQRSGDLVGKLLNLFRHRNYDKKLFDVHELLNDLCSLMVRTVDPSIELTLELNAVNPMCLGDRNQLHSSLLNILVNAKDAMPEGGKINIVSEDSSEDKFKPEHLPAGEYTIVRIMDTGTGIPVQNIDRVFEPFYTTKSPENGTGLGLPLAMEVVKHHGGTIYIASTTEGSIFSIFLPQNVSATEREAPVQQRASVDKRLKRVLLVEDEEFLRVLYRELLEQLGLTVETCCDGKEALERLNDDREFDLLITDIKMPQLNGFQLYEAIQEFVPNLPVMMVSGFADQDKVKALSKHGNVTYLQKPFDSSVLSTVLDRCLGNHAEV